MPKPPDDFIQELMSGRDLFHKGRATHVLIIQGKLTRDQVKIWVKQYHYYRANVPRKELYILANCPLTDVRLQRVRKYLDEEDDRLIGGTTGPHSESWLLLGEGLGIPREEMESFRDVIPEYKLLCDTWLNYARDRSWIEGAALSFDEDVGTGKGGQRMQLAQALAEFYGVPDWGLVHYTLHAALDIEHGASTHDLIRRYALIEREDSARSTRKEEGS